MPRRDPDALCAPMQHAASSISPEGQNTRAGNEGLVQSKARIVQETTIQPEPPRVYWRVKLSKD